jgi:hypothetical protein
MTPGRAAQNTAVTAPECASQNTAAGVSQFAGYALRLRAKGSGLEREELPGFGNAFELVFPSVGESEVGADDEVS